MNIFRFHHTLYRGNINRDFFWYCCKNDFRLLKYLPFIIWYKVLYFLCINKQKNHCWDFYNAIVQRDQLITSFVEEKRYKLCEWYKALDHENNLVIDAIPEDLLQKIMAEYKCQCKGIIYECNMLKYQDCYELDAYKNMNISTIYCHKYEQWMKKHKCVYVVSNEKLRLVDHSYLLHHHNLHYLYSFGYCFILSFIIMLLTFLNASGVFNENIFGSYFTSLPLLFVNFMPILFVMIILYLLSDRLWLSFGITGYFFYILSLINKFKLRFRDDPFVWSDIKLAGEAGDMAGKYDISLGITQIIILVFLAFMMYLLYLCLKKSNISLKIRMALNAIVIICSSIFISQVVFDTDLYESLGNESIINKWSQSQQYQIRGFVYPFLYSYTYSIESEPDGYNPVLAEQTLKKYTYSDIPNDQKLNIIGIQLESFNDLSKFEGVEFNTDLYAPLHRIQNEGISGNLVVDIFAGGTVITERSFLNGYFHHPKYSGNTNSFVRYFNEQGYYTEALHPSYGWFYNRRNINTYLGFSKFYYVENRYDRFVEDEILFDDLIDSYEKAIQNDQPYFNFTVTYQGHGPYSTDPEGDIEYLKWKDGYNQEDYNNINNYLMRIADTNIQLGHLIDYFKEQKEPVIIIFFGDHNPLLNNNNSGFEMLGVSLDIGSDEGFANYYNMPYVIWANQSAKDCTGKSFTGIGEEISPNYLMTYLFEYLGWEGNEYMKYLADLKETITVLNSTKWKMNDQWYAYDDPTLKSIKDDYFNMEFYYSHNLWKK